MPHNSLKYEHNPVSFQWIGYFIKSVEMLKQELNLGSNGFYSFSFKLISLITTGNLILGWLGDYGYIGTSPINVM